jgi:hypothetical protein
VLIGSYKNIFPKFFNFIHFILNFNCVVAKLLFDPPLTVPEERTMTIVREYSRKGLREHTALFLRHCAAYSLLLTLCLCLPAPVAFAPASPASLFARAVNFLDDLLSVRAAHAAALSKSSVTDSRGEFLQTLDAASLPVGGTVSVTVLAGDNEQTFALNGNAALLNELVVEFSGGGVFTTPGAQGYQSVVGMTVKKYVNGVADTNWMPDGNVTWSVTLAVSGLSTEAEGV